MKLKIIIKIYKKISKIFYILIEFIKIIKLNIVILFKKNKKIVFLFEITTTNEFFYLKRLLEAFNKEGHVIIIMCGDRLIKPFKEIISTQMPGFHTCFISPIWFNSFCYLDFYINATLSYDIRVPDKARYKINFPHTITAKAKEDVFSKAIEKITDTFITGELYCKDLIDYFNNNNIEKKPIIHKTGGPKSDSLFDHTIDRYKFLSDIGLDPKLPTIFYAPTWNQGACIDWLEYILEIPEKHNVNLIIKVHPGAYIDPTNKKSSGGVDWKNFFEKDNLRKKRIFNVINEDSTDFVMASDIGITGISTTWIEFYLLNKPVIFLDIPKFFETHKMNILGEFRNTYGYLVKTSDQMHSTIDRILDKTIEKRDAPRIDDKLLYNKGRSTQVVIDEIKKLYNKKFEKKVVYTYGVFDLFHSGHIELLKEAKDLGDELIVGIFTDEVAQEFKRMPIISLKDRIKVIENVRFVDKVVIQDTLLPDNNLRELKPNILAKGPGAGWGDDEKVPGEDVVKEINAEIIQLEYHDGISTSDIIKKIKDN